MDALKALNESGNPIAYVVAVVLFTGCGGLAIAVRVMWLRLLKLHEELKSSKENELRVALSSTEVVRDALNMVQAIQSGVGKLVESEEERRLKDEKILSMLDILQKDVSKLEDEVRLHLIARK